MPFAFREIFFRHVLPWAITMLQYSIAGGTGALVVAGVYEGYFPSVGYEYKGPEEAMFEKAFNTAESYSTDPVFQQDLVNLTISIENTAHGPRDLVNNFEHMKGLIFYSEAKGTLGFNDSNAEISWQFPSFHLDRSEYPRAGPDLWTIFYDLVDKIQRYLCRQVPGPFSDRILATHQWSALSIMVLIFHVLGSFQFHEHVINQWLERLRRPGVLVNHAQVTMNMQENLLDNATLLMGLQTTNAAQCSRLTMQNAWLRKMLATVDARLHTFREVYTTLVMDGLTAKVTLANAEQKVTAIEAIFNNKASNILSKASRVHQEQPTKSLSSQRKAPVSLPTTLTSLEHKIVTLVNRVQELETELKESQSALNQGEPIAQSSESQRALDGKDRQLRTEAFETPTVQWNNFAQNHAQRNRGGADAIRTETEKMKEELTLKDESIRSLPDNAFIETFKERKDLEGYGGKRVKGLWENDPNRKNPFTRQPLRTNPRGPGPGSQGRHSTNPAQQPSGPRAEPHHGPSSHDLRQPMRAAQTSRPRARVEASTTESDASQAKNTGSLPTTHNQTSIPQRLPNEINKGFSRVANNQAPNTPAANIANNPPNPPYYNTTRPQQCPQDLACESKKCLLAHHARHSAAIATLMIVGGTTPRPPLERPEIERR
ncbi:uncharacterized protein KY384_000021 [Bacidia gigantensis]|uniref:uncharacterized protein n=1 Tax=Bacidia gigantensis TaxID=2732470 RepID=UPI001D03734A|nr:uncharacterized protein KY384_000021 [Bacidia gigantensis]KAG8526428.1 hypothetical protein KY384_000021 [Bacidia gigantensis]